MYAAIWTGRVAGDVEQRAAHAQRDAIALAEDLAGMRSLQVVLGDGVFLASAAFDDRPEADAAAQPVAAFLKTALGATLADAPPPAGGIVAVWIVREVGEDATYASGQPLEAEE